MSLLYFFRMHRPLLGVNLFFDFVVFVFVWNFRVFFYFVLRWGFVGVVVLFFVFMCGL